MGQSYPPIEELVNEEFFRKYARQTPHMALLQWTEWLAQRRHGRNEDHKYRKVLQIAGGLGEGAVRHYCLGRHDQLSTTTVEMFDRVTRALQRTPPIAVHERARKRKRRSAQPRVAFLTQLTVPSESFHFDVLRGVVLAATDRNVSVSIHELAPTNFAEAIERIHTIYEPDGILMLRLTPTRQELDALARAEIPTVLLHGDRQLYGPPIIRNIVPTHAEMPASIRRWLDETADARRRGCSVAAPRTRKSRVAGSGDGPSRWPELVVVAMTEESDDGDFDPIPELVKPAAAVRGASRGRNVTRRSIRNDRRDELWSAVEDRDHAWVDLTKDYSYLRAKEVLEAYPHAGAYIALSDQVAAGLKHLLSIRDGDAQWQDRILGFDNTVMAHEASFPSFDQHRQDVGARGVKALSDFLASQEDGKWPAFEEEHIEVELVRQP
jgi:DNA-binding LacI/PurR family transcriptional regulator